MGGIERHVQSLSKALTRRGHCVIVVTLWHKGLPEFEVEDGVKIYRVHGTMQRISKLFSSERHHSPPFPDPEVVWSLKRILSLEDPQIVHAHDWMGRSYIPLKDHSRRRFIRTLHDCELTCAQMRFMYQDTYLCQGPSLWKCMGCARHHYGNVKGTVTLLTNRAMGWWERRSVDVYIPVSHAVSEANRVRSGSASVQVLPNFVLDDIAAGTEQATDPRLDQLPTEGFILQVGDLARDKGIDILVKAYAGLSSPPPLVLIGRRLAESPRVLPPGVTVIEGLPHHLVMQAWRRSLFGTVSSTCLDASPTVTLEAMISGRPVIGSRIGGIVDQIVDGVTGFLVHPGDVQELQQAMAKLIADPAMRERMGSAARDRVREFQASTVVNKIQAIYDAKSISL